MRNPLTFIVNFFGDLWAHRWLYPSSRWSSSIKYAWTGKMDPRIVQANEKWMKNGARLEDIPKPPKDY